MQSLKSKKITVQIPAGPLKKAQEAIGRGITPTIRQGLELVAAGRAFEKIRALRGQVRFSVDWRTLREDRG
jgi:hypothetical protein